MKLHVTLTLAVHAFVLVGLLASPVRAQSGIVSWGEELYGQVANTPTVPVSLPVALDDRSAPPSEAALAASRAKVKEVFEADLAAARGDREESRVFASRLLDLATGMADEPADRYAVLLEAQELAEFGLDLSLVEVILMTLDAGYHGLDVPGWKADALLRVWPNLKKEQMDLAVPLGLVFLREVLDAGDLDRAAGILAAVKSKARRHKDEAIPKMLAELTSRLDGAQAVAAAKEALLENPEARSANDLLGRYHALELGDLEVALAYLRRGKSPKLFACVQADIVGPIEPEVRIELARAWTLLANRDTAAEAIALTRAAYWYHMAIEQLSTLDQIAVQKRLDSVEKRLVKLEGAFLPVEVVKPVSTGPVLGIADRPTGRNKLKRTAGKAMEQALQDSLAWLAGHQSPDGSWDTNGFSTECDNIGGTICGDPGSPQYDVGSTGLALLAFLGEGNTTVSGDYKEQVANGIKYLCNMQDPNTGLVGEDIGHDFLYSHAIGTTALCEAYALAGGLELQATCQRAVEYILRARNSDSVWRYSESPMGENDTSVTGWMITALKTSEEAGLTMDLKVYEDALAWIEEMTNPKNGRVGYDVQGSQSSRVSGMNEQFPVEKGEAMTAVGLLCRMFMGQDDPRKYPILKKHGDLMLRTLPELDPIGPGNDMYYWYHGSYAMYQLGGTHWKKWASALETAIEAAPRGAGCAMGSFEPIGPWGFAGGRVYSTALMALCIEAHFRYARLGD